MKIEVAGSQIICSRQDNTVADGEVYRPVVAFDLNAKAVPGHVLKKLISSEIEKLEDFMADRMQIQADPGVTNMLEALPDILREATDVLQSVSRVNDTMYNDLTGKIAKMQHALNNARHILPDAE